jgi:hypothetical protein
VAGAGSRGRPRARAELGQAADARWAAALAGVRAGAGGAAGRAGPRARAHEGEGGWHGGPSGEGKKRGEGGGWGGPAGPGKGGLGHFPLFFLF